MSVLRTGQLLLLACIAIACDFFGDGSDIAGVM
jgi:hypothetical protein